MSGPRRIQWVVLAAWLVAVPAGHSAATETNEPTLDREGIRLQRAAANAGLAEKETACRSEFVVVACVNAARKEQQVVLTRLRNEEMALDDAQRKEIAARRRQTLLEKAAARDAKLGSAEPTVVHAASQVASASARLDAVDRPRERPAVAGKANRAAFEEENKAQFEARAKSAQAHREAVEQRNAEHAAKGKKANPLPVAAASALTEPASAR